VPTSDFHVRANVSTLVGIGTLLLASFGAGSRSGSYAAGPLVGTASALLAAPVSAIGAAALLAVWHDPVTLEAIRKSGGLLEAMMLPMMMVVPGIVIGTIGGILGVAARKFSAA
jgi:hypothetical protein